MNPLNQRVAEDPPVGFGRELELTPSQFAVLMGVAHGQGEDGITIRELAEDVGLARTHVTTEVGRLEGEGLLTKNPSTTDRRSVHVTLTPKAEAEIERVTPFVRVVNDALFRDIETNERAGIHRTWLTPDAQKIERRMFGRWPRPRAIKLWPANDRLYVGEGIETVLAAATRLHMQPAWALASTAYLEKFPVISGIAELVILVDRDEHGEAAAESCRCRWQETGRRVRRLRSKNPSVNDFDDLVCGRLRAVVP